VYQIVMQVCVSINLWHGKGCRGWHASYANIGMARPDGDENCGRDATQIKQGCDIKYTANNTKSECIHTYTHTHTHRTPSFPAPSPGIPSHSFPCLLPLSTD
jgi:hypothetical protein